MTDALMFVQFPHPGAELRPRGPIVPWNRHEHGRKFLLGHGQYVANGELRDGPIAFWGKSEPPSRILETFSIRSGTVGPRWLHEPFLDVPRHRNLLQNTDPLVFGERFLYSNCRQLRNRKLRELAPGSVVLFGSKLRSEFALDTVFVVGGSQQFTRGETETIQCEDWVRTVVFDRLRKSTKSGDDSFRLYRGRQYHKLPSGRLAALYLTQFESGTTGFPRPVVHLERRWIEPNLAMGAKATPASDRELEDLWGQVVDQVRTAGLALGIRLEPPPMVSPGETDDQH